MAIPPDMDHPFTPPEASRQREIDMSHARNIAEIFSETADLITALNNDQEPVASRHILTFKDSKPENGKGAFMVEHAAIPDSIVDVMRSRKLESIVLDYTQEDTACAELLIQFNFDDDSTVVGSRPSAFDNPDARISYDDDGFSSTHLFPRIPDEEMNKLIISLANGGEFEQFRTIPADLYKNVDLSEPILHRYILGQLRENAQASYSTEFHEIENEAGPTGTLRYAAEDNQLTEVTITRLDTPGYALTSKAVYSSEDGASLKFYSDVFDASTGEFTHSVDLPTSPENVQGVRRFISAMIRRYQRRQEPIALIDVDSLTDAPFSDPDDARTNSTEL